MCNKVITQHPLCLEYVPDQYKSQEMCNKVITQHPLCLEYVPDQYKSKKCVIKSSLNTPCV